MLYRPQHVRHIRKLASQLPVVLPARSCRPRPRGTFRCTGIRGCLLPTLNPGLSLVLTSIPALPLPTPDSLGCGVSGQPPRRAFSDGPLGSPYDMEEPPSGQAPQEASRRPATAVSVFAARQLEPPLCRPFSTLDPTLTSQITLGYPTPSALRLSLLSNFLYPKLSKFSHEQVNFRNFECRFHIKLHKF